MFSGELFPFPPPSRRLPRGRICARLLAIVDRDPRCKMITLDPDSAEANPEVIRQVSRAHDGKAGIYAAVVVEGTIRPGDPIAMLD